MQAGDRDDFGRVISALSFAENTFGQRVPCRQLRLLLLVAMGKRLCGADLAERLKVSVSTVSRDMLDLGELDRKGGPGLQLVWQRRNPTNHRMNVYGLTQSGRAFVDDLGGVMAGARAAAPNGASPEPIAPV